jgi:leader peptidase (prepilin peptidase)/N-methyltransferase
MSDYFATMPLLAVVWPMTNTIIVAAIGFALGFVLDAWSRRMTRRFAAHDNRPQDDYQRVSIWVPFLTASLFAAYCFCIFDLKTQYVDEVQTDDFWRYGRAIGHLVLIALLVTATATDFREYIIPDQITIPGTILGVVFACAAGDVQMMHLWVDWNDPLVEINGPYIPEWLKHRHLHGLSWSVAGLAVGASITWMVRWLSSLLLGQESLGMGDVTLMMMIGSFIGWQPVVFAFLLAPLSAVFVGLIIRQLTNKPYLPYGPYLSLAAVAVILAWNKLWMLEISGVISMRRFFGDAPGMAILGGVSVTTFVVLLLGLRLYRLIPGKSRPESSSAEENVAETTTAESTAVEPDKPLESID